MEVEEVMGLDQTHTTGKFRAWPHSQLFWSLSCHSFHQMLLTSFLLLPSVSPSRKVGFSPAADPGEAHDHCRVCRLNDFITYSPQQQPQMVLGVSGFLVFAETCKTETCSVLTEEEAKAGHYRRDAAVSRTCPFNRDPPCPIAPPWLCVVENKNSCPLRGPSSQTKNQMSWDRLTAENKIW